jgi:type IVB pilus formation R64 PilN family outer membrane protein
MKLKLVTVILTSAFLVACSHTPYKTSVANVNATKDEIKHDIAQYDATPAPVVVHKGYYVSTTPYSLKQMPKWMSKQITLQAKNLPLGILMNRILAGSNMTSSFDDSVSAQQLISINYDGDVVGALKELEAKTGYNFTVSNYDVAWSDFITKTFNISFMPGSSDYMVGQSKQNRQQNNNNGNSNNAVNHLDDMQFSNLSGRLSVWKDLENTLDDLKSKDGKVMVSESTTSVTIHDHPSNITAMATYIASLNKSLSQEVGIRVEVLEVELNKDYNFGIDWNLIKKILKTNVALTGSLSTATNLVATNLVSQANNTGLAGFQIGKSGDDNSHFLLNALTQEGKVRVVTKPQVVTMNNQIASIRITQDTGYLASITSSQFEQYQTTTITPGTVTDGFTLYLLPKIQNQDVYMQISSRIANLLALQKVSNEPSDSDDNKSTNNQFSAIEVPTISAKEFNQRSVIRSGSTLIIAGYKRLRDQTSNAKMFGVSFLGGQGSQSKNVETLVLITPTILKSTG